MEVSQATQNKLEKMDRENIMQWNIKGLKSNFEELRLLLSGLNIPIAALQDCRMGEEQSSLRGYALLRGS